MRDSYISCVCFGVGAGLVHGAFTYLFFTPDMRTASMILYGNTYTLGVYAPLVISASILLPLLTSDVWLPFMMKLVDEYAYKSGE